MDIQYWKSLLPEDFSPESRVWVYQSSRAFSEDESEKINNLLDEYCSQWISHNRPVKGWVKKLFNQFIVFIVNSGEVDPPVPVILTPHGGLLKER